MSPGLDGGVDRDGRLVLANEFADIRVSRVGTRNGVRLLVESPRSGRSIMICPLELEALTWQDTETFSAMIAQPQRSLMGDAQ